MKRLNTEEMKKIEGGADPVAVSSIIGIVVTVLIGVFHGYSNPDVCRN